MIGTYLANLILDYVFGKQSFTPPDSLYVGLATNVTAAGVITGEPSGNGYARVEIANDDIVSIWSAAEDREKTNGSGPITFPVDVTSDWGTLGYWFIIDSSSGAGNLYWFGPTAGDTEVTVGKQPFFSAGGLSFDMESP